LLAAILASSEDGIITRTRDGVIVSWNAGAERIFGCSAAEAVGRPMATFFASARAAEAQRLFGALVCGTSPETIITEGIRKDGGRVVLSVRLSPIGAQDAQPTGGLAIVRDVSNRGDADARGLGAPESVDSDADRLSVALDAAHLGDWSWDAPTDVVTLSARAAKIFGIPAGLRMTWSAMRDMLHPDDRDRARLAVEQAMFGRTDYLIEYRVINGDRERWICASGRGTYDDQGIPTGMFGVVQDLTRDRLLVRVDDAVRPLVSPEDITYTAAALLGQHLNVNRCAYATVEDDQDSFTLTGNYTIGVESIVGRYRFRHFGAECLRLMRAGEPWVVADSATDPRIDHDDRRAYALTAIRGVICVPILKAGRFVAAMAVHTNAPRAWSASEVELMQQVSGRCWESIERARVEREREGLLEAAEAANRAKDEFMAMLGHELRNPLAPILTALHLIKQRGDTSSERERTVIERQVNHLTRLVDDLLDVSRIASGKVELKREIIELAVIVARSIELASPVLEQRVHTLTLEVPPSGLAVEGDAARLTQVVANLLTNAGKYTPAGGRITVSAAADGDHVVLRVKDTGVGMSPEVVPTVFDLFVQGRQSIDRAQGGLGLGLTIVRSLVERHGGTVSAHSEGRDKGSELVVRLPRARTTGAVVVEPTQSAPILGGVGRGARILVVDDNEDAAEMMDEVLTMLGCQVHVAHDGPQALRLAANHPFDLALLDIGLPVMDGYELAGRLQKLTTPHEIRLVAVTGYGQASDRQRAADAGFCHHMVKPVDMKKLTALVTSVAADAVLR
jgi:PAS domain S-box-containing protein